MQDLGCKVIFLIGDYTAQIGDPTGKSKVRPEIEQHAVEENMHTYLSQVGKILRTDKEVFTWIRNSDWFLSATDLNLPDDTVIEFNEKGQHITLTPNSLMGKMAAYQETRMQAKMGNSVISSVSLTNLLWTVKHITLAQLSERDMFQKRIHEGESLYMHEMLYPIIQGIDSDMLARIYGSCDLEVGGTDQTFNLLMGRRVMEMNHRDPQAVLSFELLVGLDGKEKMSKSLDNYVSIIDGPTEMFGKMMSIPDTVMESYYMLCTFTPLATVKEILAQVKSGKLHPKEAKMNLAQQITEIYHGRVAAEAARTEFDATFAKGGLPDDIQTVKAVRGELLVDVLLREKFVPSKTEFRRLIEAGALRKDGEEKLTDAQLMLNATLSLKVGKHRFVKIVVD
jgi:tyrosyl-tRNA synthetase